MEAELGHRAWSALRVLEIPDKLTLYTAVNELVVAFEGSLCLWSQKKQIMSNRIPFLDQNLLEC